MIGALVVLNAVGVCWAVARAADQFAFAGRLRAIEVESPGARELQRRDVRSATRAAAGWVGLAAMNAIPAASALVLLARGA